MEERRDRTYRREGLERRVMEEKKVEVKTEQIEGKGMEGEKAGRYRKGGGARRQAEV